MYSSTFFQTFFRQLLPLSYYFLIVHHIYSTNLGWYKLGLDLVVHKQSDKVLSVYHIRYAVKSSQPPIIFIH